MHTYNICYRIGPAVDLLRREMTVAASNMTQAAEIVHGKLYYRFPRYRLISIVPLVDLPLEEVVETWRDRA
jgi:hypothetical protein